MEEKTLIQLDNVEKSFFGVTVFKDFSLDFKAGEIHCICGENGAGKSTLIKILSGVLQPNQGSIFFDGNEVVIESPKVAMALGIQTIYQEHTFFGTMSVWENLFIGREETKDGFMKKKDMVKKSCEILEFLQSDISPYDIIGRLSEGEQKIVEIARGLLLDAKVIIMDEPTSSFSRKEIEHLMEIARKLRQEGICVIYVSHHLEEVFEIADRVTVIRDGQKINTYSIEGLTYERLINDMVGRDVSSFYKREPVEKGDVEFCVKNLTGNGVNDISFDIRKGEILGFAGMVGAGKTEIAELIFGVKKLERGEIYIRNNKVILHSPKEAIRHNMCYITESRQHTGLFLDHSILENVVIVNYGKTKGSVALPAKDKKLTDEYVKKLNIITTSTRKKVKELSGGNQQKVVLAKWFATNGDIFIFDEPTRGIDIGAREEIYKLMTELIKEGKCIMLISSDMPELIALSDRICVMRQGEMVAKLEGDEISEQTILKHSIGGAM